MRIYKFTMQKVIPLKNWYMR